MEIAVLLAAGLRDWVDFDVIVNMAIHFAMSYNLTCIP